MNVLFCERVLIKYGELKIKTLIQIIVQYQKVNETNKTLNNVQMFKHYLVTISVMYKL